MSGGQQCLNKSCRSNENFCKIPLTACSQLMNLGMNECIIPKHYHLHGDILTTEIRRPRLTI
ncbi:hypothetical protein AHF37_09556 [Paragonimus kellicotti]|nr:hypothetical protein AHF37_09556 [Paragonimus kellicotti]